jgi:hypothetical protein
MGGWSEAGLYLGLRAFVRRYVQGMHSAPELASSTAMAAMLARLAVYLHPSLREAFEGGDVSLAALTPGWCISLFAQKGALSSVMEVRLGGVWWPVPSPARRWQ